MTDRRQVFAFSGDVAGRARPGDGSHADLLSFALGLCGRRDGQRVCYLPTAVGDSPEAVKATQRALEEQRGAVDFSALTLFPQPSVADVRAHLLAQDLVLVEGGSVVNLMALWRAHGLDRVLRECWEAGVVLAGPSAGSLCWHRGGPTDSFRDALDPFFDGLGLLPFSNGVHDDLADQPRRQVYRDLVARGVLGSGYATEDGVGLHFVGTSLAEAVTMRRSARAWWVEADGRGGYVERPVTPRAIVGHAQRRPVGPA